MKRIIYTLLAVSVIFASCQKQDRLGSLSDDHSLSITDPDFAATRATVGSNKKNNNNDVVLDYDLVFKSTGIGYGKVGMRIHGMRQAGKKMSDQENEAFRAAIFGIVLSINNTKQDPEIPLDITLTSNGVDGQMYTFPEFAYKGDLAYELANIKVSVKLKDGGIKLIDKSSFLLGGSTFTVTSGNLEFKENSSFTLQPGTSVNVNSLKLETSFAILFTGIGKGGSCDDDNDYYILPKGHSVEQDPKIKKVTFPKGFDEQIMRITVVGDPNEAVTSVFYTPAPYPDPKNPDVMIQPAAIEFHRSEPSEKKIGICCYDRCITKKSGDAVFCGTTDHFKPADFNANGPAWARLSLKIEQ
jgi:hypothetical protein